MNLHLPLRREWFEKTKNKIKTEDYREITPYWFKRLVYDYKTVFKYIVGYDWDYLDDQSREVRLKKALSIEIKRRMVGFNPYERNIMTLGYPRKTDLNRILNIKHISIEIREGNPEWGAEPNKLYFVIKHGTFLDEV